MKFSVTTYPGYNQPGNGQHPTELIMAVTGKEGACVWRLATGLSPVGSYPSQNPDGPLLYGANVSPPHGMGFCAHSELNERTMHDNESSTSGSCDFLEGRACVCEYSYALDKHFSTAFACEGFTGVERLLREEYTKLYGVAE